MLKKQLIMESAIELFAKKGIDATSVQQITEHCGISKGAFYLSFKSKDELIFSIIDYFTKNVTANIERSVSEQQNPHDKLAAYFMEIFNILQKYGDFATVFIKEQHFINETLIDKMAYYDELNNKLLLDILRELYPSNVDSLQYDLIIIIKGLIASYGDFIIKNSYPFDIEKLTDSLVEKIKIIAKYGEKSFFTKDMFKSYSSHQPMITKDLIVEELQQLLTHIQDEVLRESLQILEKQIQSESPSKAIILGMLSNLKNEQECDWFCYMMRKYYELNISNTPF
ncbi:TetR/AcrR family transcriptional regulator [Ureibacillus acetophenoni]|uniref:TetR family transcriptional regulator n=1 Tax=Ureibacillus acetophenoni TaxID=614649 RepID=A0A285UQA8_9BACL|nr:TetR/AcrR family transcriptional regulator [Ureibacillus acetophenoni]SOC42441.1 TetR family transcriptional regulator [Ureibacillus acetophenoni]